jgi:predicted anti-sigma-YlaC factor YlaD
MAAPDVEEIVCRELVELVTSYLEHALDAHRHALLEEHLVICEGCRDYLEGMRRTRRALAAVPGESLSPARRLAVLDAFSEWAEGGPR